jgi:hypothetical protein
MIDLYIGGACPYRALTFALPRALICPSGPLDGPVPKGGLGVVTACGSMKHTVKALTIMAAETGQPWLIGQFADRFTSICSGITLLRPVPKGVETMMVHPFIEKEGAPMILISSCAGRAFAFDAQGQIRDVSPPKRDKASAGADRGWGELRRRMKGSALGNSVWPHGVAELRFG